MVLFILIKYQASIVFELKKGSDRISLITGHLKGLNNNRQFDLAMKSPEKIQLDHLPGLEFIVGEKSQHVEAPFRLRIFRDGSAHLLANAYYQLMFGQNCTVSPFNLREVFLD